MRLLPSDPDVETIVSRINSGDINLQPDFQRGEVWGKPKKQRLIDSILRDWHVPPIHVIENPKTRKQEVLDGQQRLASIRDFVKGEFPVDGNSEPIDPAILSLDGKLYQELPEEWRRRFNQFTIRVFRIVDYQPSEPAELFFRLNQPTSLTGAEQRNAFFGPVRQQIKELVDFLSAQGLDKKTLAFSNFRMAYDDVLSRTALAVERRSLAEKITSADLNALYRTDQSLSSATTQLLTESIMLLASAASDGSPGDLPKFNKATLFSWLIFVARGFLSAKPPLRSGDLKLFLSYFEKTRRQALHDPAASTRLLAHIAPAGRLFTIYETRASARVADVSSVLLRDAIIWLTFDDFWECMRLSHDPPFVPHFKALQSAFVSRKSSLLEEEIVTRRLIEHGWASLA
jgi:hypothetical protein